MLNKINSKMMQVSAAMVAGMMIGSSPASANNFGSIASNVNTSIESLPGLLTALSYMFGIILGVLGIMKIKDHVENPGQTPLKDGAIRLAAGGALFALPIVFDAMLGTNDATGANQAALVTAAAVNKVSFNVL